MKKQKCNKCLKTRLIKFFLYRKDQKKYRLSCKICENKIRMNRYYKNPEMFKIRAREYRKNNFEKCQKRDRDRYYKDHEATKRKNKELYRKNRKKRKKQAKVYREKNKKRLNAIAREYYHKHKNDREYQKRRKDYSVKYRKKNSNLLKKLSKEFYKNNIEYYRKRNKKYNQEKKPELAMRQRIVRLKKQYQEPKWNDKKKMKKIYEKALKMRNNGKDFNVDHVLPLQGKTVSGLHVHTNLKIISSKKNFGKSNRIKNFQSMEYYFGKNWLKTG